MFMVQYRPVIGIPCRPDTSGLYPKRPVNAQNIAYSNAALDAGGIPILIPVEVNGDGLADLFQRIDGLIFCGGGDIDPVFYDEPPLVENLSTIQKDRDAHELELMRLAIEHNKPFLAICRGIQVMNVAVGGNLWQDIYSQYPQAMRHDYYYHDDKLPRNHIAHEIRLDKHSLLYEIIGADRLSVNSLHHQAAKEIGATLEAVGFADDGIVEVLEVAGHSFGLGVQWHPEELVIEHETARKLFGAFIEASRNGREAGR
jgi:putative glutamine amidotransferase